jgi:4-amino-4-deoxy-L-arabinose transferase-like glycosyltransferase
MLVLVALGLVVRVVVVLLVGADAPADHGDARYYHLQAEAISEGAFFVEPFRYEVDGTEADDASHPPLYSVVLAVPNVVGIDTYRGQQLVGVAIGVGAIVLIGLLGRRLAGPRAGLIAAALATLYPSVWAHEALVLAEVLVVLLVPAVLLLAYAFRDRPTVGRAMGLSAVVALLALTRSELLFLAPLLVLPLLWRSSSGALRWRCLAAAIGVGLVLIGPWMGWNLVRFEEPVLMSHQLGQTMAAANCRSTYDDRSQLGYIDYRCIIAPRPFTEFEDDEGRTLYDPIALDDANQQVAIDYIREHADQVPAVVLARVGRAWEFYYPSHQVSVHEFVQNRPAFVAWATVWFLPPLVALAVVGALVLRRAGEVVWPMLVFAVLTTATAAITFGSVRYRAGSDVVVIVLAAIALDATWRWWQARRASELLEGAEPTPAA